QFSDSEFIFLAATHPLLQQDLVKQLTSPKLIVADTRDMWIENDREELVKTLGMVNGAILNDFEARLLTGINNLVLAGQRIIEWGPVFVVIKKGEHGSMLVTKYDTAALPAFPTTEVKDPTGAGDSFAGGMMGYLATQSGFDFKILKYSLAVGTITASFTIEDFSLRRIRDITMQDIDQRLKEYSKMLNIY
ncbi:unnamed protein product, partial [marine sediment metagenome]